MEFGGFRCFLGLACPTNVNIPFCEICYLESVASFPFLEGNATLAISRICNELLGQDIRIVTTMTVELKCTCGELLST
jgi:hypothetical protein